MRALSAALCPDGSPLAALGPLLLGAFFKETNTDSPLRKYVCAPVMILAAALVLISSAFAVALPWPLKEPPRTRNASVYETYENGV